VRFPYSSYIEGVARKALAMISNPILHDIIKSELAHNADAIFNICKTIPNVKNSNLFKKDYWQLKESRQEERNKRYYQADCVWYFDGQKKDNYYIVHEVKTGGYSIDNVYNKYRTGMSGQIWIWGWEQINNNKSIDRKYQRKVKIIPLETITKQITSDIKIILEGLM